MLAKIHGLVGCIMQMILKGDHHQDQHTAIKHGTYNVENRTHSYKFR